MQELNFTEDYRQIEEYEAFMDELQETDKPDRLEGFHFVREYELVDVNL